MKQLKGTVLVAMETQDSRIHTSNIRCELSMWAPWRTKQRCLRMSRSKSLYKLQGRPLKMRLHRRRNDRTQSVRVSVAVIEMFFRMQQDRLTCIALTAASCRLHDMAQIWRTKFTKGCWKNNSRQRVRETWRRAQCDTNRDSQSWRLLTPLVLPVARL